MSSCVGTIESKKSLLSKGSVFGSAVIEFEGIRSAKAISHDKVEVTFPAAVGDIDNAFTYTVLYNNSNSPNFFKGNELQKSKDDFGNFKIVVDKLDINTNYVFSVQVLDSKGNSSVNSKTVDITTFPNATADFNGISAAENQLGMDGMYGLKVQWVAAIKTGLLVPDITDVFKYEVTTLEEPLTPVAFDNPAYANDPKKKILLVGSDKITASVNGLKPDTNYYVRVRAIHYGYETYKLDPSYKKEENSKAIKLRTYASTSSVSVQPSTFIAASTNSSSSLDLSWVAAKGPFLNYRVYFAKLSGTTPWDAYSSATLSSSCLTTEDASGWKCKTVPATEVTSVISDLEAYQPYQVGLLACQNVSCSSNQRFNVTTSAPAPPLATFGGITSIGSPKHYYALETIYLNFSPPDFSSGVINGIYIKFMGRGSVNPVEPACILNDPLATQSIDPPCSTLASPYSIASFDFKTDTVVEVVGVDVESLSEPYCFKMIPYIEKNNTIERADETSIVERCITPVVDIPNSIQFSGLINAVKDSNDYVTLEWTPPSGGIFTQYEIFVRTDQGTFSFAEALGGSPGADNYNMINLPYGYITQPSGNITYTFGPINLPAGQFAEFGVLVSKPDGASKIFSQNFSNIRKITW